MKHEKVYKSQWNGIIVADMTERDKWKSEGKCIHCGSTLKRNEKYDAMYCPKCLYWTEKICPDRKCEYCSKRPKYPRKNKSV